MAVPRSLQEIIDDAERLADQAETFEPADEQLAYATELAAVYRTARDVTDATAVLVAVIAAARDAGALWREIGTAIGTTGEAARRRFGQLT